ncbi:MAG: IPExxxVDY family protein [Bacteroidales bacterium]|nr:IPExxxVDY family protein [Bacteroidales bacterium]
MKKRTHKLDYQPEFEFDLIGISSHENDYRISWAFNKEMKLIFVKTNDLEIESTNKDEIQKFSKFTCLDEDSLNTYHLISNRCDNGFLLDEFKNLDYFLLVLGEYDNYFIDDLIKKIKSIDLITIAFRIDLNNIKNKSKLKLIF